MMNEAKSVLAKLKNESKKSGKSLQLHLQLFCQEERLRRISKSSYAENFILKGGLLIYTLSGFQGRATVDMDFLMRAIENSLDKVEKIVGEIINTSTGNDFIAYNVIGCEKISVDRKYNGISVKLIANIANTKTPLHMDFGVGDVIVPDIEKRKIITQLDAFEAVEIMTYSLESTVAEKIDAILQRFELTSRMKDFYDIYYIGSTFDFDGKTLYTAVKETTDNRGTKIESDSFDRIKNLKNNAVFLGRWKVFQRKFSIELSFEDAIDCLEVFMSDILHAIALEHKFEGMWQSKNQMWEFK